MPYDKRVHAVRRDVADIDVADWLFAPHYARSLIHTVSAPFAMLLSAPAAEAEAVSQLLLGEAFHVLDETGGWAWGYCQHDHYVGYIRVDRLGPPGPGAPSTHLVSAREAPVFAGPSIKSRMTMTLSLGARVAGMIEDDFLRTPQGFIHTRHVAPIETLLTDPTATAERLLGAPYLWGGRGARGIDCSGLVQLAVGLAGWECPRDSDQQCAGLGRELVPGEPYQRGDIAFFPGHVGLMIDASTLLHANAWRMAVTIEPLADVVARLQPNHEKPLLAVRRLEP